MLHFVENNENVISVVWRILSCYSIKVTHRMVIDYIKTHPDYPSLKSICDFFDEINIRNYALKMDKADLFKLEQPFLAYLKVNRGRFFLVYSIDNGNVIYTDSLHGRRTTTISNFLDNWDGVVIIIEPDVLSGQSDYLEKRKKVIVYILLVSFLAFSFSIAVFYSVFSNKLFQNGILGFNYLFIVFTHVTGLVFSSLLFMHELKISTKFTERFCDLTSKTDCNAVAESKVSIIFGDVTWADVGVVYFIGGLAMLFIFPVNNSIGLLKLLSVLAMPYPFFSIFYQWLKLKKWCPLCLMVQFILISEFIILSIDINKMDLNVPSLIQASLTFSIVLMIIILMKLLIINEKEKDHIILELMKIKRDPDIFIHKLKHENQVDFPYNKSALVFGNLQSQVTISIFSSLNCSECGKKFNEYINLIKNKSQFKVQFIFSSAEDELSAKLLKVIFLMMKTEEINKAIEFLDKWDKADRKTKSEMLRIINFKDIPEGFDEMINYNAKFFQQGIITKVPAVYVNGFSLPGIYNMEDIKYHIPALINLKHELSGI